MSTANAIVMSNVINGLDTEAINVAVSTVAADPKNAHMGFRAKTTWQGKLRSVTDISSFELGDQTIARQKRITADEPLEMLGDDSGPNPQELLLSALAACMTVGFVVGATTEGIHLDSLEIETSCALDLRGVFGLDPEIKPGTKAIQYKIRVKGSGTKEQFELIHQRVMATSPNYYHLASPIPFVSELVVG